MDLIQHSTGQIIPQVGCPVNNISYISHGCYSSRVGIASGSLSGCSHLPKFLAGLWQGGRNSQQEERQVIRTPGSLVYQWCEYDSPQGKAPNQKPVQTRRVGWAHRKLCRKPGKDKGRAECETLGSCLTQKVESLGHLTLVLLPEEALEIQHSFGCLDVSGLW